MGQSQLTIDDAADVLGWSPVRLRRAIRAGELRLGSARDTVLWEDVRRLACTALRVAYLPTEEDLDATTPPDWLHPDQESLPDTSAEFQVDRIVQGNCLDWMHRMPAKIVQTVITSPPYWGVRRYADDQMTKWGDGSQIAYGQEKWPEDYVRHTLEILRALKRVVRDDGIVWWNVGDTYMTRSHVRAGSGAV